MLSKQLTNQLLQDTLTKAKAIARQQEEEAA